MADYVVEGEAPRKSTRSNPKAPPNAAHKCSLLFPVFGGRTATILRGLIYPKILCVPERGERKREKRWHCVA